MARAVVEVFEDEAGGHRWRLKAENGEIVATGEAHTRPADARRAFGGVVDLLARVDGIEFREGF